MFYAIVTLYGGTHRTDKRAVFVDGEFLSANELAQGFVTKEFGDVDWWHGLREMRATQGRGLVATIETGLVAE